MYEEPRSQLRLNRIADNLKDSAYEIQRQRAELVKDRQHFQSVVSRIDDEINALDRMLAALGNANRSILAEQQVRVAALAQEEVES